jgi:hypothetical protein
MSLRKGLYPFLARCSLWFGPQSAPWYIRVGATLAYFEQCQWLLMARNILAQKPALPRRRARRHGPGKGTVKCKTQRRSKSRSTSMKPTSAITGRSIWKS